MARETAARDEKTKGPFVGRRRISRPEGLALSRLVPVPAAGDGGEEAREAAEEAAAEGLLKANEVNEEDSERDRATHV